MAKPSRRNFLKAAAAFFAAPLVFLKRQTNIRTITVNNKPLYEGHAPQDIPKGATVFCIWIDGKWILC